MGNCPNYKNCIKVKTLSLDFDIPNDDLVQGKLRKLRSSHFRVKESGIFFRKNNEKNELMLQKNYGFIPEESGVEIPFYKDIIINNNLIVNKLQGKIEEYYKYIQKLGEGSYGEVHMVQNKLTLQNRALKRIKKQISEFQNNRDKEINMEIEVLKKIDHPNIVKIFEFFHTKDNYFLITEFCDLGELFEFIIESAPFDESSAAYIMYQIFSAVNYCHSNNILHRDLKPENILIERIEDEGLKIKIIDFGCAKIFTKNHNEKLVIGSSYYMAPEIYQKNYTEKCDIWSCGVILYILLSAKPPFNGNDDIEIKEKVKKGEFKIEGGIWENISPLAKNLLKNLLEKDQGIRISAEEALNHKWFKFHKIKNKLNYLPREKITKLLENLKLKTPEKTLKRIALAYLVHNNPQHQEVIDASKLFNLFDKNSDGKICKYEFTNGLNEFTDLDEKSSRKFTNEIFGLIDEDNNGYIECEEFVRSCMNREKFLTEEVIEFSFYFFDKDRDGEITFDEIYETFSKNFKLDLIDFEENIRNIIGEVDINNDDKINLNEFKMMMNSLLKK